MTAVEWLWKSIMQNPFRSFEEGVIAYKQAKEMEKQQQDNFAIGFAEWCEEEILAKGDYNMIDKSKIELLEIYKKEKGL